MRNSGIGHAGWEPIGYRDIRWQKPINWNIVPKIVFYDIGKRKYNVALLAGWSLINNCLLEWQVEYRILTLEMCRVLASLFFFFIFSFSEKRGWPFIFRPSNVSNVFWNPWYIRSKVKILRLILFKIAFIYFSKVTFNVLLRILIYFKVCGKINISNTIFTSISYRYENYCKFKKNLKKNLYVDRRNIFSILVLF